MHEEIEYAEMLEIPISTVNVIKKPNRHKKNKEANLSLNASQSPAKREEKVKQNPLRDSVIAQVNDKLIERPREDFSADFSQSLTQEEQLSVHTDTPETPAFHTEFLEDTLPSSPLDFDPIPERIDTVRLFSKENKDSFWNRLSSRFSALLPAPQAQNEGGRVALKYKIEPSQAIKATLNAEFVAACALCGVIFLTNVFMPSSAFNTFFRAMNTRKADTADARTYSDFTLSPIISVLSDADLNLSSTGILSFTEEGCVYPAADGTVSAIETSKDGTHLVKISYSDSFTGIISGLDYVYYTVGDSVKANVPLGYSEGETEVQVTMYSEGVLLNCFELTEENCLTWLENH